MAERFQKSIKVSASISEAMDACKRICANSKMDVKEANYSNTDFFISASEKTNWLSTSWPTKIEIKGTITTRDITKRTTCKFCGHKHEKEGNLVCVTPIFAEVRETGLSDEKGKKILRNRCEVSNMVTVIAPLCRDPQLYVTEKGTYVTTYQLAIRRKFRIKKDTDIRTDFPWVKSYGGIAANDARSLKKGAYVFIDGRIQVRQLKRIQVCENCGETYEWTDSATEIVPYAVEYLRDFYTKEEIEKREKEEGKIAAEEIFSEEDISLNRPTDVPDFKDDDTEDLKETTTGSAASDVLD